MPGAREQAAMVCGEDGRIYLFGGLSQDRYNDMRVVEKPFAGKGMNTCIDLFLVDDEWIW